MKRSDLTGLRFGRLVAVRYIETKGGNAYWLFVCDCGSEHTAAARHVKTGSCQSCGCRRRDNRWPNRITHGDAKRGQISQLYMVWASMRQRCKNHKAVAYRWYGARGIRVDPDWEKFPAFKHWAVGSGFEDGLVIDRIDPDQNYCPANCRWVSAEVNNANARAWGTVTTPKPRKKRTAYNRDSSGKFVRSDGRETEQVDGQVRPVDQ